MRSRAAILALLALAGCAAAGLSPSPRPVDPVATRVLAKEWSLAPGAWLLRQSLTIEAGGRTLPLGAFLRLEGREGRLRVVAMDDLGITLLDLGVTREGHETHFAAPQLARQGKLVEGIAGALRRSFLDPRPRSNDIVEVAGETTLLRRPGPDGVVVFTFGADGFMQRAEEGDGSFSWSVEYGAPRPVDGFLFPGTILYRDQRGEARVTGTTEEARHGE